MQRRGGRWTYIDCQPSALIRGKGYLHAIISYTGKPGRYFEELEVVLVASMCRSESGLAGGVYL